MYVPWRCKEKLIFIFVSATAHAQKLDFPDFLMANREDTFEYQPYFTVTDC